MTQILVDARWLAARLDAPDVCVLDVSWHQPATGRNARAEFERAHIPGARFFDLAGAADPDARLSHTLPGPNHLAACAAAVGARRDRRIVLYDSAGLAPSARVWWMLSTYGFREVHVLDGGLAAWERAGFPLAQGPVADLREAPEQLSPPNPKRVADFARVKQAAQEGQLILDARSAARYRGEAPEPLAGIRSGHIPGSRNLPYQELLAGDGTLLPISLLRQRLQAAGVTKEAPVVCSCGSGVTACVLALALESIGHPDVAVYDGSWSEWAQRTSLEQTA
ncbi:sulfurtransferase [Ramlibacter henchirensis]|nr:sulfurtransferase [Ramlibacter henchirensis]